MAAKFKHLEKRIARTGEMLEQLVRAQGDPIRLDYPSASYYMYLFRQRDKGGNTIGAYWRIYHMVKVGRENRKIYKKGWPPKRVPPAVIKKMDEANYLRFSEVNAIAKAIYSARQNLVKKKQNVLGTLNNLSSDESRMQKAEELLDEFVI